MVKNSYEWRHIELAAVIFSILGLVIAITEYEIVQFLDGHRGLLLLHDDAPNTPEDIKKAIDDIVNTPNT